MFFKIQNFYIIVFFICTIYTPLYSQNIDSVKLSGPLYGKNYYLPHLLTYSFPGFSPHKGLKGANSLSLFYSGISEFVLYANEDIALDYESSILESSFTYRVLDQLLLGIDVRLISFYPGFMDPVIDFWHNTFHFADAGRDLAPINQLEIFIDNSEGKSASLTKEGIYIGDTDLYSAWNIQDSDLYSLAVAVALKLPTGSLNVLTGSDYFDLGLQLLGEWNISSKWSLGLQQGVVFPGDIISKADKKHAYASLIQSQTFLSIQYYPQNDLCFVTQFRVNTSPIQSDRVKNHDILGASTFFTRPQTSMILGIKRSFGRWMTQISIEEDTFTYEGVDIQFSLRVTRSF